MREKISFAIYVSFTLLAIYFFTLDNIEKEIVLSDRDFKFVGVEFDLGKGTSYIKLRSGEIRETKEIKKIDNFVLEDFVNLDFDKDGKLIGVEVIKVDKK